jgi:hypothetical protein
MMTAASRSMPRSVQDIEQQRIHGALAVVILQLTRVQRRHGASAAWVQMWACVPCMSGVLLQRSCIACAPSTTTDHFTCTPDTACLLPCCCFSCCTEACCAHEPASQ